MSFYRRLFRSLATWPDAAGWARCALIAAAGLAMMALLAVSGGLWLWRPEFSGWPGRLLMVMIVPALTEETVFRGLLTPDRSDTNRPVLWVSCGVALFVLWHVFEAATFLPGARPAFFQPAFLACAAVLGAVCALMRYQTGSLWPAVAFHGLVVFLWQTLLSGPGVKDLVS